MNFKNNNVLYKTTTDNRTYKIKQMANKGLCCMGCVNRHRRTWYHIWNSPRRQTKKYPSWKLVSKNKKQWMKKPLKFKPNKNGHTHYTSIEW
jgi:hypothetical protein